MNPSLTAIQRALNIAKQIGERIDPGFGGVDLPKVGAGVPLERADGGEVSAQDYSQPDGYMNLYSKAATIASQLPMQRASPAEWRGALLNRGVKPAEIKWSEFEQRYPGNEPISREDVAGHFHRSQPDLYETDLRGNDTKYDQWTMPGGENYREVLLHETDPREVRHQHSHWEAIPTGNVDPWDDEPDEEDIPNVYVHARLKDRRTPSDSRVLHVEELQSDWGQDGRKGFRDPDPSKVPQDTEAKERYHNYIRDLSQRMGYEFDPLNPAANAYEAAQKAGEIETLFEHGRAMKDEMKANFRRLHMPIEGPYVGSTNDWVDLGLKHLLTTAAANDHEHLAWTPGQKQAERYPGGDEEQKTAMENGMRRFYDDILPKRLLKLARMHDPDAQLSHVGVSTRRNWDRSGEDSFESLPSLKITPKMRESILKRGFPAYASGGAVDDDEGTDETGDDGHPLTNPVYHGIKEGSVSSPMAQGLNMEMFDAKHPSLNYNALNHIALGLGPHVSRDPNIAGDYRFTTGEDLNTKPGEPRRGARAKGRVMMLNTLPDEKFLPVRQEFNQLGGPKKTRDYDDNAVYNTVYSDVFRNNPELAHEVLTEHGYDHETAKKYVKSFQTGKPFTDPYMGDSGFPYQSVEDFVANNGMLRPGVKVINKVLKDFRKRMRERGYTGLSYINTDADETANAKDKKCYIVFPQRDKETGWYPMRYRHAAYDPQQKGSPVLTRATGGEVDDVPENPYGGLAFPQEDTDARLRTSMNRQAAIASGKKPDAGLPKNPRTVINAPEAVEGEKQLPDFTVGQINFDDWKKRHENILSDSEIHHSANWYKNIYGNFLQYYPDPKEAKRMMRAWLVAQQNVSPAGAMNNVLMQREQMERGDPEHLWTAGGMPNPTAAARNVLRGQEIGGGVGQKISDFVDSAEGKGTRSWMGDHPHGGDPFVVDVHTARDTGMVDQELINHLSRLGYNKDQLDKLKIDLLGSPTEAAYENRANFGRELTKHLNSVGWKGRSDWTPAEVQAVGWMGMTKLTRNAEEDSESGLGRNLRRISFELSPGEGSPWEHKYGKAFEALPEKDRYDITQKMTESAMKHAQKLSGVNLNNLVHGTGAWENWQNPSSVGQTLATQRGADITAAALGHLLHQTEVWHNRVKPMSKAPKGFALDFIERGSKNLADPEKLRDFWSKVMETDSSGLVRGYQPITLPTGEVGIRALIDKGGVKAQAAIESLLAPHEMDEGGKKVKKENPFRTMLESHPFDIDILGHEAEITKHRNDWKDQKNGQGYISRLVELLGRDPSATLNSAGGQLAREFESHLDEAHARQGTSWRKAPSKAGEVGYALGGVPKSPRAPFIGSSPGSVERALLIAKKMRYG